MADIVTVEPDGTVGVTGYDPTTKTMVTVFLSPLRALELIRELASAEWRFALHPIRDDRAAFDASQEASVS
jgi:hypothetical protein